MHLAAAADAVPADLLALDSQVTDCNAAIFDVANNFHGVIAGCHEILRRQGLLEGIWCLDPNETLGPGQKEEIDRVCARLSAPQRRRLRARKPARAGWHDAAPSNWPLRLRRLPYSRGQSSYDMREQALGGNPRDAAALHPGGAQPLLLVAAWYLFVELGDVPKFVMPSPYDTMHALLVPNYRWVENIAVTGAEIFGGYILAVVVGIGIALLFSWFRRLEMVAMPLLVSLNMIPKVALGPLIIVWFSYGIRPEHPDGVRHLLLPDRADHRARAARGRARPARPGALAQGLALADFTKIQLPGALPYIFSGMKVAAILAVAGAIVGEFLGSDRGLGYLMLQVQVTLDTAAMFMAVILITLIGMVLYGMVLALERLLVVRDARHP